MTHDTQTPLADERQRWFTTTHWSVVLRAREDSARAGEALETLCRQYWSPLYTYVRRRGYAVHDAQDLVQQFIAHLLARDFLNGVSPDKGRFRSFLLASLNNFLGHEFARANAQKRGGGAAVVSLDAHDTERWLEVEAQSQPSPDALFERRWALTLFDQAFQKLRGEYAAAGKLAQFDRLKPFLEAKARPGDYEDAAADLDSTAANVAVAVHRLKQRYSELLRREVADTVDSPDELEAELRHLAGVLSR